MVLTAVLTDGHFSHRSPSLRKISCRGKHWREVAPDSSLNIAEGRKIYRDVVAQLALPPVPAGIHTPLEGGEPLRRRRPLSTPQHVVSRLVEVQVPGFERIDVSAVEQLVEVVQIPALKPLGDAADLFCRHVAEAVTLDAGVLG